MSENTSSDEISIDHIPDELNEFNYDDLLVDPLRIRTPMINENSLT